MKFRLGIGSVGGAVALSLAVGSSVQAADFTFTQISQGPTPISPAPGSPSLTQFRGAAINDLGRVAFEAFLPLPAGAPPTAINPPVAIFAGNGGPLQPVSANTSNLFNTAFTASINNPGTVTFTGNTLDFSTTPPTFVSASINSNVNGTLNQIATTGNPGFRFFGTSDVNDAGTVAFLAGFGQPSSIPSPTNPFPSPSGIFTTSATGGPIIPVVTTGAEFSNFNRGINLIGGNDPFTVFTSPSINNAGSIAFTAGLNAGGSGVFVAGSNGTVTPIANSSQFGAFGTPAINNPGTVAFVADPTSGSRGIFTGDSSGVVQRVSSGFQAFLSDPAINDQGNIAFFGQPTSGNSSIYLLGANNLLQRVIGVGDTLLGRTIAGITLTNRGLNNRNEIAFSASFSDGTEEVFRAQEVPEPASIAGIGAVACGILLKRKQRKKVAQ